MAIDAGNAFVSLNGVDVSALCTNIGPLDQSREEVDITAFGASIRVMQATLEQSVELALTFNVNAFNDTLHSTLATMWSTPATAYAIKIRPTTAAISVTNPEFQFDARLIKNPLFDTAVPGQTYKRTIGLRRTTAVTVDTIP